MVNTQGAEPFRELAHAEWFGFTLADWVFPNFIFMVGMAIAIVFSPSRLAAMKAEESASRQPRQRRRQSQPHSSPKPSLFQRIQTAWKQRTTRTKMTFKVIKRSILLFLIGCALNAFELIGMPSEEQWLRVPGVLQRIAFCYFVLASTVLWLPQNLVKIGVPLVMTAIWFLLTYAYSSYPIVSEPISTCAMETLVEGVTYRLKPGQLAPSECTAQAYIDTMMFSKAKDPLNPEFHAEGSVGCFTSVVSAWFGWMMGLAVLDHQQRDKARTANLCRRETLRAEREKALYSLATMATASLSTVIAPSAEPRSPNSTTTWPSIAASGTSSSGASDTEMLLKKRSLHGVSSPPLTDAPPLSASTSSSLPTVSVSVADPLPSESPPSLLVSPPPPPRHSELILALPPSLPPPYQPEVDLQQELETQNRTQLLASLGTWFCTGTCVMAVGVFFGWFLPIGKPLWTPTYVLYAGGMSICALCILIHTYDVQSLHAVTPNPIVMTNQQQQHQQQQQQQQQQGLQEPSMDVSVATSASHRNGDNSHRVQTDSNGDVDDEEDENDDNDNQESRRRFKHWRTRCREGTRGFTTVLKTVSTKAADWTKRVYRWTVHVLLAELFIAYGRNPMLIYVLADVVAATLVHIKVPQGSGNYAWVDNVWAFIFFNSFYRFMNPTWASVVFSFVYVLLFFPLLWELDRRGLYLRL
ncbi:hypothetical protein BGW41_006367 [Actinomortierella wolfii]|nr:hypothetical protein BGW41_006367 [Actinomortierella wolfii]